MKYQLFILSFLYMYLPCDEMFLHTKNYGEQFILEYSWGIEA